MKAILILGLTLFVMSCEKRQDIPRLDIFPCDTSEISGCSDVLSSGNTCAAYFESWVFNPQTNNCEFMGYSGCGPIGFATEEECEECECNALPVQTL